MSWKEQLEANLEEEDQGFHHYMKMAEEAEKDGCCHEAGVLRDMAHEEKTHARLIREIIDGATARSTATIK